MYRYNPTVKEGILIVLVGIIGIFRTLVSLPDAGIMITEMLYTMFFIFAAIALIGIKVINDARKKQTRRNYFRDKSITGTTGKP